MRMIKGGEVPGHWSTVLAHHSSRPRFGSAAPQDPPRSTDNMMEWVSKWSHAEISMKAVNCLSPASHARPSGISSGQTICSVLKLASMEYLLKSGKWEL